MEGGGEQREIWKESMCFVWFLQEEIISFFQGGELSGSTWLIVRARPGGSNTPSAKAKTGCSGLSRVSTLSNSKTEAADQAEETALLKRNRPTHTSPNVPCETGVRKREREGDDQPRKPHEPRRLAGGGCSGRNNGGALGADCVQTETKQINVWFKIPNTSIESTVGLQGIGDVYSGVFDATNDMAGIAIKGSMSL